MTRPLKGSRFWRTLKAGAKTAINISGTRIGNGTISGLRKNQLHTTVWVYNHHKTN